MSTIFIGKDTDGVTQELLLNRANRHGLVAGATGTGKTVTLQILSEGFSKAGVPVFAADVKGDLSGLCQSGSKTHKLHDKLIARSEKIGLDDYSYSAMPTIFWDLHGKKGHPIRATISEMGAMLLSNLMGLTDAQEGIMNIAFDLADDNDWPLVDLNDLRAVLTYVGENRKELSLEYGNIATQSVGAIIRNLLVLEREGAEEFFGEPALKLSDFMLRDGSGQGYVNILAADDLINTPRLYATFLLWLMSELFEELPEVGDPDKPVMAFFFDEAHLLFDDAPDALVDKITQVARLIRSKGVSLWFVTQNPADIPDDVLGQVGNRIQHALRGYTPKEQKAIRASADAFRPNPNFKTEDVISELGVGEALVSVLDAKGRPQVVGQTLIRPPASRLGPATAAERKVVMAASPLAGVYDEAVDPESAYEMLAVRREAMAKAAEEAEAREAKEKEAAKKAKDRASRTTRKPRGRKRQSALEAGMKAGARSIASSIGRSLGGKHGAAIARGILGGIMRR
ncbi:helicase HerA-like domain-containing protein [Fretibacter rubidus]|uniref:helicase HerA-like domain-containing protein n=1 Tax=Fretibacter rubidus TaxID=570162 RepID=UPI00352B5C40